MNHCSSRYESKMIKKIIRMIRIKKVNHESSKVIIVTLKLQFQEGWRTYEGTVKVKKEFEQLIELLEIEAACIEETTMSTFFYGKISGFPNISQYVK